MNSQYSQIILILFFSLLILFAGCSQKQTKKEQVLSETSKPQDVIEEKLFEIDPRTFDDNELELSDFASDVEYIPLSNKIRMGHIRKVKVTSNAIYLVSDKSSGGEGNGHQELFRFDKKGKNTVQIGKIGKGPKEYLKSKCFAVDEENNRIYIIGRLNTVLVFDTKGIFIRDFKFQDLNRKFSQMELLGKYLFVAEKRLGANTKYLWTIIGS